MRNFLLVYSLLVSLFNSTYATKVEYRNGWIKCSGMDILLESPPQDYSRVVAFLRDQKEKLTNNIEQDDLDDLFCLILTKHGEELSNEDWNITYEDDNDEQPIMNVQETVQYLESILDDSKQQELEKILENIKEEYSHNGQQDESFVKGKKSEIIESETNKEISPIQSSDDLQQENDDSPKGVSSLDDTSVSGTALDSKTQETTQMHIESSRIDHTGSPKDGTDSEHETRKRPEYSGKDGDGVVPQARRRNISEYTQE